MWPAMKNLNASLPNPVGKHLDTLRLRPPSRPHAASFFDPPTSTTCQRQDLAPVISKVLDFVHKLLPPWLENHSYRVFAQGLAIADTAGWSAQTPTTIPLNWDRDVWFIVAMLHDLGWDSQCTHESKLSFEIYGGIKARELLTQWGAPQDVCDLVCEVIIRHTGAVGSDAGRITLLGALAQLGPGHDFLGGASPAYIHPADNNAIIQRWPRLGMVSHAREIMIDEVGRKPGCLGSGWAPHVYRVADNVRCYKDLQGVAERDLEWEQRRKELGKW